MVTRRDKEPMPVYPAVRSGVDDACASRHYIGPERRAQPPFSAEEHQRICEATQTHLLQSVQRLQESIDSLSELIKSGFPGGDPGSHRKVHEGYIAEAETRKKLKLSVIEKTLTGVVWASIVVIAYALWEYIKLKITGK